MNFSLNVIGLGNTGNMLVWLLLVLSVMNLLFSAVLLLLKLTWQLALRRRSLDFAPFAPRGGETCIQKSREPLGEVERQER